MKTIKENLPVYQECVEKAKNLLFQGTTISEIKVNLLRIQEDLSLKDMDEIIGESYKTLYKTIHRDREFIFQLHMNRYEDLYRRSVTMEDRHGRALDANRDRASIIYKAQIAMKILKQKEDLLGLHNNDFIVEIDNNITSVEDKELYAVRLARLGPDEKIELLSLIKKARTVPIEGDRQIIVKKKVLDENNIPIVEEKQFSVVQDIQYEEMPEQVVDKLQEVTTEKDDQYIESPIIIDNVDRKLVRKSLSELKHGIDTNLKKNFEKLIRRKK